MPYSLRLPCIRKSSRPRPVETNAYEICSRVILTKKCRQKINTKHVDPDELVSFAESLQGVPYKYGSAKKRLALIVSVLFFTSSLILILQFPVLPSISQMRERCAIDGYANMAILYCSREVIPKVGWLAIWASLRKTIKGMIRFIHSASGNGAGVMISGMNRYFVERYVKVIRYLWGMMRWCGSQTLESTRHESSFGRLAPV